MGDSDSGLLATASNRPTRRSKVRADFHLYDTDAAVRGHTAGLKKTTTYLYQRVVKLMVNRNGRFRGSNKIRSVMLSRNGVEEKHLGRRGYHPRTLRRCAPQNDRPLILLAILSLKLVLVKM
jgi:hypothetical protein